MNLRIRQRSARGRAVATAALLLAWPAASSAGNDPFGGGKPFGAPRVIESRAEGHCGDPRGVSLYVFPERPIEGETLRIVAVSETPKEARLVVFDPSRERREVRVETRGGPPYSWLAEVGYARTGRWEVRLAVSGDAAACATVDVQAEGPPLRARTTAVLWPIERVWDRETENLYSAWIEKLFDDPLEASPRWSALTLVTRDPRRNFLHDSLGLGEDDEGGLELEPDCADLPYFLRGYFAWKLRLPFQYSRCYSTAAGREPPVCRETMTNLEKIPPGRDTVSAMQRFFARGVADCVHSATGRTAAADDRTDLYPIRIAPDTLRPGVVFIDPYGHVLIVARRLPQVRGRSGILLAVDAQPDGTVARKQYWRGNFLFALGEDGSASGFKRFRPVVPDGGSLRALDNAEVLRHPSYGDWSMQQYDADAGAFYDRVDAALSPAKRPVRQVLLELVGSLQEQVEARVASVQGGENWMRRNPGTMTMPNGAAIFQTVGPWEDWATPARDLRLLIAIDVVRGFPASVVRRPNYFQLPAGRGLGEVRRALEAMLQKELASRSIHYERTDGSPQRLTLAEVVARATELEMGYNPNDCIETRWGAAAGSPEARACRRRTPPEQLRRMHRMRDWFRTRTRPST